MSLLLPPMSRDSLGISSANPWKSEDVVVGQPFSFSGGAIAVPGRPGLGVELDRDALGRLHEQYLACGLRNRDDTGYMQRVVPGYERRQPRW